MSKVYDPVPRLKQPEFADVSFTKVPFGSQILSAPQGFFDEKLNLNPDGWIQGETQEKDWLVTLSHLHPPSSFHMASPPAKL